MIRRPPRSTRTDTPFPTRRAADPWARLLGQPAGACKHRDRERVQTRGRHLPPALLYARQLPLPSCRPQRAGASCCRPILSTTTSSARSAAVLVYAAARQGVVAGKGGEVV